MTPPKNQELHGNAPDESAVVLIIIDMINDLEFQGGEEIRAAAESVAERIAVLRERARAAGVPVIYANDNFGKWRSDFRQVVDHCLHDGVRGQRLAELLKPGPEDYFVLKTKNSAFFATTLDTLLDHLGAKRVILTGIAGDVCVLLTAAGADLRDYLVSVPVDCTASVRVTDNQAALAYMKRVLHADITESGMSDLEQLRDEQAKED